MRVNVDREVIVASLAALWPKVKEVETLCESFSDIVLVMIVFKQVGNYLSMERCGQVSSCLGIFGLVFL